MDDQLRVDQTTEEWLGEIESKLDYRRWYFGHFHENREMVRATMLFEGIQELGKEGFVQKIGRPHYRKGEMLLFQQKEADEDYECYGRIVRVDEMGTQEQHREVSYDVEGPDFRDPSQKRLYSQLRESEVQSLNELQEGR